MRTAWSAAGEKSVGTRSRFQAALGAPIGIVAAPIRPTGSITEGMVKTLTLWN